MEKMLNENENLPPINNLHNSRISIISHNLEEKLKNGEIERIERTPNPNTTNSPLSKHLNNRKQQERKEERKGQKVEKLTSNIFLRQTKAILKRDLKLNILSIRFLILFIFLQILMPFFFSRFQSFKGRRTAYYSIIVLNASLSRLIMTKNVEERAKKFRSVFRLMGLKDIAYSSGVFLSNIIIILIGIFFVNLGNFFFNSDFLLESGEFWHFEINAFFASCAIMAMNLIFSLSIKNPKVAADVSGIYVFSITFM